MQITTKQDFTSFVETIQAAATYRKPLAFGICRASFGQLNTSKIIACQFATVNWAENYGSAAAFLHATGLLESTQNEIVTEITIEAAKTLKSTFKPFFDEAIGDAHRNVQIVKALPEDANTLKHFRLVVLFANAKVESLPAAYLKLAAMSARKVKPREIIFDGAFAALENVAWEGQTPYEIEYLRQNEIALKMAGKYPAIDYTDKFPRYLMQVVPEATIRITDGAKVRFGAYLSQGTTIMPGASYINFNAGTLGKSMVEGRISSSATIGDGTDVGGGASILGTLSGGNNTPITIGDNCLLGANSTTGIPLGDACIVDAGVTILAGTKIRIEKADITKIASVNPQQNLDTTREIFKGSELAGAHGIHYRVDSVSGATIATRSSRIIALNAALHG